jgi:hypothetical protein
MSMNNNQQKLKPMTFNKKHQNNRVPNSNVNKGIGSQVWMRRNRTATTRTANLAQNIGSLNQQQFNEQQAAAAFPMHHTNLAGINPLCNAPHITNSWYHFKQVEQ